MSRRSLRIATTSSFERSAREAGFDVVLLPPLESLDFHRPLQQRFQDGGILRPFLEKNDVELLLDFNTEALTLVPSSREPGCMALTTADLGIPYVACYLDPITSTMSQVPWSDHWHILENKTWIKWIWETAHAEELSRLGVPNVLVMPMAAPNDDYDTSPLGEAEPGPVVAFMGHPASSWFRSGVATDPAMLLAGLTAAAVHGDLPDLAFHKIFFDLYQFAEPTRADDDRAVRAQKAQHYFNQKFAYNAFLAVRQRDRFARFLKLKLGAAFELIGDHWQSLCGLEHTPRIWDAKVLHQRMRRVPICLNLMKGCLESGLNYRHFEITANGGFMLTYETSELSQFFEIGRECDVFRNEEELLQKIAHYMSHDKERREIARLGQQRTLREHLYSHRIHSLTSRLRAAGALPRLCDDAPLPADARSHVNQASLPSQACAAN